MTKLISWSKAALFFETISNVWNEAVLCEWLRDTVGQPTALSGSFDGGFDTDRGGAWSYVLRVAFSRTECHKVLAKRSARDTCSDAYEAECAGLAHLLTDLLLLLTNLRACV